MQMMISQLWTKIITRYKILIPGHKKPTDLKLFVTPHTSQKLLVTYL